MRQPVDEDAEKEDHGDNCGGEGDGGDGDGDSDGN